MIGGGRHGTRVVMVRGWSSWYEGAHHDSHSMNAFIDAASARQLALPIRHGHDCDTNTV